MRDTIIVRIIRKEINENMMENMKNKKRSAIEVELGQAVKFLINGWVYVTFFFLLKAPLSFCFKAKIIAAGIS